MSHQEEIYQGPPEKPVSEPPEAPTRLLEVEIPTLPPQALFDLIEEGRRMVRLAQQAHQVRNHATFALNALKDEGCAPGTWYEKKGKYLVVEQRIDGQRVRRYIGSDPTKKAEAMAPYRRYRTYLEILDLVAILDRVIARLVRHLQTHNDLIEDTTITLRDRTPPIETPPQEDIPPH